MKKIGFKSVLFAALAALVVLAGCDLVSRDFDRSDDPGDLTKGSLVLILDGSALPTRTIVPEGFSMNVGSYDLVFTNPGGEEVIETIGSNGLFSRSGLTAGSWSVKVHAYNSANLGTRVLIGAIDGNVGESVPFTIVAGDINIVAVNNVGPIVGTGRLALSLSWPGDALQDPRIEASLVPAGDPAGGPGDIAGPALTGSTWTYENNVLATGYYLLTLRLYDDASLAWGWIEAVRIIDYGTTLQTSSSTWDLTSLTGQLSMTASASMQNPLAISFSPEVIGNVTQGSSLSVTAACTPAGTYTYQWYLNGAPLVNDGTKVTGATSAEVTFPSGSSWLTLGEHNLSVLVTAGSTLSSETIEFTVVE